jgi:hypothetical protein
MLRIVEAQVVQGGDILESVPHQVVGGATSPLSIEFRVADCVDCCNELFGAQSR